MKDYANYKTRAMIAAEQRKALKDQDTLIFSAMWTIVFTFCTGLVMYNLDGIQLDASVSSRLFVVMTIGCALAAPCSAAVFFVKAIEMISNKIARKL